MKQQHNKKSRDSRYEDFDDADNEDYPLHTSHKKDGPRRRPVRNWKKAWVEHQTDYDDRDEFFGK